MPNLLTIVTILWALLNPNDVYLLPYQDKTEKRKHSFNIGLELNYIYFLLKDPLVTQTQVEVSNVDTCPSVGLCNILQKLHVFGLK